MAPPRKNLLAGFQDVQHTSLVPAKPAATEATAKPADYRKGKKPFTVWLDESMIVDLRHLSNQLVATNGRKGNTIEALISEAINGIFKQHNMNRH